MNNPIRTVCYPLTVPFGEYWIAYRTDWGPDLPVGQGKTEQEAFDSLLSQEDTDDLRAQKAMEEEDHK